MNNKNAVTDQYQKSYVDLRFERGGLFEFITKVYHPQEVLYPGCSIHITPAFYFPYVVFVDLDPTVMAFFSNHETILDLVKRRRNYKRSPYIRFIYQDFTKPLPIPQNQFDLLLALFTGGVSKACSSYLRKGGLLLTNNHQSDAAEVIQDNDFDLIAMVQKHQGKYRFVENETGELLKIRGQTNQLKHYLRQTNGGLEYIENELYYVFRRTHLPY